MRRNLFLDGMLILLALGLLVTGAALWQNTDRNGHGIISRIRRNERRRRPWITAHRGLSLVFLGGALVHLLVSIERIKAYWDGRNHKV